MKNIDQSKNIIKMRSNMFCFIMLLVFSAIMCLVEEVSNAHVSVMCYVILENTIVRTSYPSFLVDSNMRQKEEHDLYTLLYTQYKKSY